jgi:hypothetical protein
MADEQKRTGHPSSRHDALPQHHSALNATVTYIWTSVGSQFK